MPRNKSDDKIRREWETGLAQFNNSSGGLLRVYIVRRDDLELVADLIMGNPTCWWITEAVQDALRQMEQRPTVCLHCNYEFRSDSSPGAFICIAAGYFDEQPQQVLASPICQTCYTHTDKILLASAQKHFAGLWPDLRKVDISDQQGTA